MMNLHRAMMKNGIDSYVVWGRGRKAENDHEYFMDDSWGVKLHGVYTRITDKTGFASTLSTRKLLNWLDEIEPDIIHPWKQRRRRQMPKLQKKQKRQKQSPF